MSRMRLVAVVLTGSMLATGCGSNSYEIKSGELSRLAQMAPEARGEKVRVSQEMTEANVGQPEPVQEGATIVVFPAPNVYGPERRRYYTYGGGGSGPDWNGGIRAGGAPHTTPAAGGGHSGGGHSGGSGGDAKGYAVLAIIVAVTILVAAAAVEGSRFDGYAQLHPMQPVHLFGKDGGYTVLPLAWIDPQTAEWADHAIVRTTEGPVRFLERAPLDRPGFSYALMTGLGTYRSVDGSTDNGAATEIQLGYWPDQKIGVMGSVFFGWRNNAAGDTLFESRYTLQVHAYPVQTGPLHLGLYGGAGEAYRWEDYGPGMAGAGNSGSTALVGGALLQLDINTRIALTGRFGVTYAHDEQMSDALIGLSVY
jgi:hypothetical protein